MSSVLYVTRMLISLEVTIAMLLQNAEKPTDTAVTLADIHMHSTHVR
jgi:hypothetical protein